MFSRTLSIFAISMVAATAAFAYGVEKIPVWNGTEDASVGPHISGTIFFPEIGRIPANKTCFDKASEVFKTFNPGGVQRVCTKSRVEHNYPGDYHEVCDHWEIQNVPAKLYIAPLHYSAEECVLDQGPQNQGHLPTCHETTVTKTNSTTYYVGTIDRRSDPYGQNPSWSSAEVAPCPAE